MVIVDSNIILDILDSDPNWSPWSSQQLRQLSDAHDLAINPIIYSEISIRFSTQATLDEAVAELGLLILDIPLEAAFVAGKAFVVYRRRGGTKGKILADFFIGAHAAVLGCPLITRDPRSYFTYFSGLTLIAP
ncbi:MAG: type II toxin-antitoxin system VapC family toxin [Terracidiphilus sp.]